MRTVLGLLTISLFTLALAATDAAQAPADCSKYSGVEKEACEKMAARKR